MAYHHIFGIAGRAILFAALGVASCLPARGLDPDKVIAQYAHMAWTVDAGLPHNTTQAITQTPDGFLWVGTELGLARFDGAKFLTFNRENTSALRSNAVTTLATDGAGTLWIGTDGGGLTLLRDGKFTAVTESFGSSNSILALYPDREGAMWIGTDGDGLVRYRNGIFEHYTRGQDCRTIRFSA